MTHTMPKRPATDPVIALQATEHLAVIAFAIAAARSPDPQAAIEQARAMILQVVTKDAPLTDRSDIQLVDHFDWLLDVVSATLAPRFAK